ncbi:hypothetical protein FHR72_002062 [Mycolicibacterium iranicum]|uniref:Uncharacterized protein n=1 Tax=Mycolicibacterium iranicum TaxID=912594 RepID=A0A839Q6U8_MYCIR|nr:hypothetical protein [Mycolicibacterium iranicum]MBB2990594.1 hypothetical protein [Mycolicibacterium iranicum]
MPYQIKVLSYVSALFVVVAGGLLGAWAYMELEHRHEQERLLDCIRSESVDEGDEPAMRVVETSILQCQD